jgi:polyribonucleotide nucleotidyltransferase
VQVILYSFSIDGVNPIDILAINAASAAIMISDIPWGGPVGAVRVGHIDGNFVINPTYEELNQSDIDLRIAGTRDAILMVECGANEVTEDVMAKALELGHIALQPLIDIQEQMAREVGKEKRTYVPFFIPEDIKESVYERTANRLNEIYSQTISKSELNTAIDTIGAEIIADLSAEDEALEASIKEAYHYANKRVVRERILNQGQRPDGRGTNDIRPIWAEVNISPRAHGSGLFTRGETQVLTLATLGTPREAQELDNLTPTDEKRYMHHYNFPPFSTGETKMLRGASRRDIGHGALAERAIVPMLPSETDFPYTLRLVSEVLSSNGSTSMASVCGSTLALMDTGVPIKSPVAGIAMGLIKDGDRYAILSDIQGLEDHSGDMDFKVAGTKKGITALQMDTKIRGITTEIMSETMDQARQGRIYILDRMLEVIAAPNSSLKPHVPRLTLVKIPIDKIGAVIGPGGKTIRSIQDETGTKIDISEEGYVFIASANEADTMIARERIESLTEVPEIGRIYTGRVVRVTDFGAFVEILPNLDGLVHISQLDTEHVRKVEDVVEVGDEITVMITNIDNTGKIRLSRQAVLAGWTVEEAIEKDRPGARSGDSNRSNRSRSGGRPGGQNRGGGSRNR